MEKLVFNRKVLELSLYGKDIELRFPTNTEYFQFSEDVLAEGCDPVAVSYAYIEKLGLPKDCAATMHPDHLATLMETLNALKKS